ncbi:MAG: hypothetical protein OEM97_03165, partial [Acidimicrobiia bacterium]|nr:hypothetical protein [Acidimicrobiia bacterium]
LRMYLVAMSSAALAASFLIWSRLIRWGAPLAAGLFAVNWSTLFYGSEVSPNLFVAYAAVAAVGMAVWYGRELSARQLAALAAMIAVAAVFRPSDAALLAVAAVAAAFAVERRSVRVELLAAVVTGFGLGLVPWLLEAWVRFGGPLNRLQQASDAVGGGISVKLAEHARLLDGPLIGPDASGGVITAGLLWVGVLGLLGLVGAFAPGRHRRAGAAALVTSALMSLPYLFSVHVLAPRFLLPALALLCAAAGVGVGSLLEANRRATVGVLAAVILACALWNVSNVSRIEEDQVEVRSQSEVLGSFVRGRAGDKKCSFVSQYGYPQVELASACDGRLFVIGDTAGPERLEALAEEGQRVFVVSAADPMLGAGWECETVETPGDLSWHVCTR